RPVSKITAGGMPNGVGITGVRRTFQNGMIEDVVNAVWADQAEVPNLTLRVSVEFLFEVPLHQGQGISREPHKEDYRKNIGRDSNPPELQPKTAQGFAGNTQWGLQESWMSFWLSLHYWGVF
ncbi:MAG: hypothetical protein GY852_10925, partial [bacterium]|nr:hypothetical protein [bacterium]